MLNAECTAASAPSTQHPAPSTQPRTGAASTQQRNELYDPSRDGETSMQIKTLNDIFAVTSEIDRPAIMKYKKDGRWHDVTVPEFRDTVRWFSTGLRTLG